MLRQRRIQTKEWRSLRDRSRVIQISSKQALRMRQWLPAADDGKSFAAGSCHGSHKMRRACRLGVVWFVVPTGLWSNVFQGSDE
jgi:hypothetical protein